MGKAHKVLVVGQDQVNASGLEFETLGDVRKAVGATGYAASIDGKVITDDSTPIPDGAFVSFAKQVKGN